MTGLIWFHDTSFPSCTEMKTLSTKPVKEEDDGSFSENTVSWLKTNSMDADIVSYSKSSLLQRDEYFFKIWYNAGELFK